MPALVPPSVLPLTVTVFALPAFLSAKLSVVALAIVNVSPLTIPVKLTPSALLFFASVAVEFPSYVLSFTVIPVIAVIAFCDMVASNLTSL